MERNIMGKSGAEMITAGWRTVRSTERCASAAIWVGSEDPILGLRLLGALFLARSLERAPRLLQEDVVQGRLVEPEVGYPQVLGIECPHHVREAAGTAVQPDGDGPWLGGDLLAEAPQNRRHGAALARLH